MHHHHSRDSLLRPRRQRPVSALEFSYNSVPKASVAIYHLRSTRFCSIIYRHRRRRFAWELELLDRVCRRRNRVSKSFFFSLCDKRYLSGTGVNISSSSLCNSACSDSVFSTFSSAAAAGSHDATSRWLRARAMLARLKIMSASLVFLFLLFLVFCSDVVGVDILETFSI